MRFRSSVLVGAAQSRLGGDRGDADMENILAYLGSIFSLRIASAIWWRVRQSPVFTPISQSVFRVAQAVGVVGVGGFPLTGNSFN